MTAWEVLGTVLLIGLKSVLLLVALLVFIAYALLADRKIWAAVQMRRGPNVVGVFGLLQPFADGNPLLDLLPFGAEYDLCVVLGLVGAIVAALRWRPVD